jgi:hypothetical protein
MGQRKLLERELIQYVDMTQTPYTDGRFRLNDLFVTTDSAAIQGQGL